MINKLLLLSAIVSITACKSYSEKSQCDPEKNYIISDPVAMEEYRKLRDSGEVTSYYSETMPVKPCFTAICFMNILIKYIQLVLLVGREEEHVDHKK